METATACPAFLWAAADGASGYELVVLDLARPDEPTVAIRGENPATGADQHGVWGRSASTTGGGLVGVNTAGGPDLVLDGAAQGQADTRLSQSGIDRSAGSAQTFNIQNSGAGGMALQVGGNTAWHAGNDGATSGLDADLLDGLQGTSYERRVIGTCPSGQTLQGINADGSVVCLENPRPPMVSTVDSANVGLYPFTALGTDGFPVISYFSAAFADLIVVKCNDAACTPGGETINTVDSIGDTGSYTSLAVGTDGFPVIGYYNATNGDLRVMKCNDAACAFGGETISTVDSGGVVGQYSSLALGTDGFPVISYHDQTNADLKVAKCNSASCRF